MAIYLSYYLMVASVNMISFEHDHVSFGYVGQKKGVTVKKRRREESMAGKHTIVLLQETGTSVTHKSSWFELI